MKTSKINADSVSSQKVIKPNSEAISSSSLEDVINSFIEKHEDIELCLEPVLDDKKMLMYVVLGGKPQIVKPLLTQKKLPKSGTDLFKIAQWAKEIGFNRVKVNPVVCNDSGTDFLLEADLDSKDMQVSKLNQGTQEVFTNLNGDPKRYKNYFRFIDSAKRSGFRSVSVSSIDLKD